MGSIVLICCFFYIQACLLHSFPAGTFISKWEFGAANGTYVPGKEPYLPFPGTSQCSKVGYGIIYLCCSQHIETNPVEQMDLKQLRLSTTSTTSFCLHPVLYPFKAMWCPLSCLPGCNLADFSPHSIRSPISHPVTAMSDAGAHLKGVRKHFISTGPSGGMTFPT